MSFTEVGGVKCGARLAPQGSGVDVIVSGDVDVSTAQQLRNVLLNAVDNCRTGRVQVDLSEVTFMDSIGLSVLITASDHAKALMREVVLVSPGRQVRRLLDVTGLETAFPMIPAAG